MEWTGKQDTNPQEIFGENVEAALVCPMALLLDR